MTPTQQAKKFFSERGIKDLPFMCGNPYGWRTRAKLAVRGTSDRPLIGLYQEGTHEVVDLPFCPDHHPKINEAIELVRAFIRKNRIEPYHEETGQGLLRYLQFVVERSTGKVQLSFVLNKKNEEHLERWDLEDASVWHSIWLNFNTERTNTIFGSRWSLVSGSELLWEHLGGVDVCFHPASFAQANLELFERVLASIGENVPASARIAEFYAGVGVIGLTLAQGGRQIKCCEITEQAQKCFAIARNKLRPDAAQSIEFFTGLATNHLDLLEGADTVIVDPPRKGLDRAILDALKEEKNLHKIVYLSCGWKSFQRDCDELLSSGWILELAETYLFFPGTNHLETLAFFKREAH